MKARVGNFLLAILCMASMPGQVFAADFSVRLTLGQGFAVTSTKCRLAITTESTQRVEVGCTRRGRVKTGSARIALKYRQHGSIRANSCDLVVATRRPSYVNVKCIASGVTPPNNTPQPLGIVSTPVSLTATPTQTPTPTNTPSGVVNGACYVAGVDTGELVNGTGFCSADGLLYVAGAPANGVVNGVLYQQGVAYNGIYQGGLYTNGVKVSLDGALDKETFQGTGFTKSEVGITSNTEWLAPTTVLIQSDSKIVVVGHAYSDYDGNRVILRYLEDGTPDASFGTAGAVVLPGANWIVGAFQYGEKLILATSQVIFRLNADGSPDRGFGQNGQVNLDAVGEFRYDRRIALQPDGRIIVAGLESNTQIQGGLQLALGRFDTDGLLDDSFGTAGIVNMHDLVAMDSLTAATQTDGKILISYAQQTSPGSRESHGTIYRFNHDGSVDTSFGDQGKVTPASAPGFHWITSQPDGGVLAALYNTVYRFNSKGELDLSFGDAGVVTLPGAPDGLWGGSGSAVVQQDGKILVNGYTRNDVIVNGNLAVKSFTSIVRLKPDGKVDDSFGTNGIQHLSFLGSRYNSTAALAIQSDGRIVGVASFVDVDGKEKIVTFRLWS